MKKLYDTTRLLQEVLNRPVPENPPDLTEGPPLATRTGQIAMAEVKRRSEEKLQESQEEENR